MHGTAAEAATGTHQPPGSTLCAAGPCLTQGRPGAPNHQCSAVQYSAVPTDANHNFTAVAHTARWLDEKGMYGMANTHPPTRPPIMPLEHEQRLCGAQERESAHG